MPSPVQAACWIDIKRKYLELRPNLRRVYLTVADLTPYAEAARRLGFRVIEEACGEDYQSAMLDFGPSTRRGSMIEACSLIPGRICLTSRAGCMICPDVTK
jgi:hypothetical protein